MQNLFVNLLPTPTFKNLAM